MKNDELYHSGPSDPNREARSYWKDVNVIEKAKKMLQKQKEAEKNGMCPMQKTGSKITTI